MMLFRQAPSLRNGTSRSCFLVEHTGEGSPVPDPACPKLGSGLSVSPYVKLSDIVHLCMDVYKLTYVGLYVI